jgi:hypothetical protein
MPPPVLGPTIGAHALVYQRITNNGQAVISTPALATMATGSTMIVGVGRGDIRAFEPPTDNLNASPFTQIGSAHPYTEWQRSGTALYARQNAVGGPGLIISNSTPPNDEITLAAVEIYGGAIEEAVWNEVLLGSPLTSASVTTTGPATLVAFWWGDADAPGQKGAVPDGGFTVIDSILEEGMLVQCAVAVKHVETAGTYNVRWNASPAQGAQMWLVAVAD